MFFLGKGNRKGYDEASKDVNTSLLVGPNDKDKDRFIQEALTVKVSSQGKMYLASPNEVREYTIGNDSHASRKITTIESLGYKNGAILRFMLVHDTACLFVIDTDTSSDSPCYLAKFAKFDSRGELTVTDTLKCSLDFSKIAIHPSENHFLFAFQSGEIAYWKPRNKKKSSKGKADKNKTCLTLKVFENQRNIVDFATLRFIDETTCLAASKTDSQIVRLSIDENGFKEKWRYTDEGYAPFLSDATLVKNGKILIARGNPQDSGRGSKSSSTYCSDLLFIDWKKGQLIRRIVLRFIPDAIIPYGKGLLMTEGNKRMLEFNPDTNDISWNNSAEKESDKPLSHMRLLDAPWALTYDGSQLLLWQIGTDTPPISINRACTSFAFLDDTRIAVLNHDVGAVYVAKTKCLAKVSRDTSPSKVTSDDPFDFEVDVGDECTSLSL